MMTVFQARVTDEVSRETTVTTIKGTVEWIASITGSEVILESAEEVDISDVDSEGRYTPPAIALEREVHQHAISRQR